MAGSRFPAKGMSTQAKAVLAHGCCCRPGASAPGFGEAARSAGLAGVGQVPSAELNPPRVPIMVAERGRFELPIPVLASITV